jgi:tetratricopeptide (TPR) repeat protein
MNQLDEAVALLRQAAERAPDDFAALEPLARVLHRRFEGAELVGVCRRILAKHPDRTDILGLLSNGQIWLGQFDEVEKTRKAVLALQPDNRSFAQQVGGMIPGFIDQSDIRLCQAQLADPSLPSGDRINAGFALAKTLDREGDYDAAFEAYQATNGLIRAGEIAANRGFRLQELRGHVANMQAQYTPALFTAFQPLGNPSELPVFIAGMPRSGTSLVEQIAASHPRVFGAGERKDMMEMVLRLNRDRGFVWPTQWDIEQFRLETSGHVDRLRDIGGGAERVIDKLPDNIQLLGQIRVMFPNARIIICRRDLRDVCVSCFTTRFGDSIAWSNDLRECAQRAVEIERLTDHWRSALPGPVLEVSYETLVGNLEAESRRLIDFLGLEWNAGCLEFHKTKRVVTTSSAWQVRQPLYDSSVGRWRRYRKHLGPMLEVLAGHVPDDEGEP